MMSTAGEWHLGESRLQSQRLKKRFRKSELLGDEGEERSGRFGGHGDVGLGGQRGSRGDGWGSDEGRKDGDLKWKGSEGMSFAGGADGKLHGQRNDGKVTHAHTHIH